MLKKTIKELLWNVLVGAGVWQQMRILHNETVGQENIVETAVQKVSTFVDIIVVNVLARKAIVFYCTVFWNGTHCDREHQICVIHAFLPWAKSKISIFPMRFHFSQTFWGDDILAVESSIDFHQKIKEIFVKFQRTFMSCF